MKKYILYCFLSLTFATSCSTVNWLTINIQKPAQVTLPVSVQNLAIVNNSITQPSDIGHKSINYSNETEVNVSSDSLNIILTEALTQFLDEEEFFNSVVLYDQSLRNQNDNFLSEIKLSPESIRTITNSIGGDIIISLDRLILKSILNTSNIGNSLTSEELKVNIDANFRLYYPNGQMPLPLINFQDSLSWEAISQHGIYFTENALPSRREALKYATLYTANKMVSMFAPYWQEQNRWYYTDGTTKMQEASVKASANRWKDAALIWGEVYETEKDTLKKAKLASNISLANEMLDDLENALTWINISSDLFNSLKRKDKDEDIMRTSLYKKELTQRISDFQKLDIQEGIESQSDKNDNLDTNQ